MKTWENIMIGIPVGIVSISISNTWLSGWIAAATYTFLCEMYKIHKRNSPTL